MDRDCANITQTGGQKRADLRNHRRDPVFSIVVWHRQSGVQRFSSDFSGAAKAGGLRSRPSAADFAALCHPQAPPPKFPRTSTKTTSAS